jgi:hypothetical protein
MDGEWIALHIFYSADTTPVIVEAVHPLVKWLYQDGLISGWFFIRYWQEGPHIRLRLKPSAPAAREEVTTRAVNAVQDFLKRRPAFFEISADAESRTRDYKKMYVIEYGEARWNTEYGVDGRMPIRPNNSIALLPYEPEYERYGGHAGVRIAEWHFEQSSDMVALLLARSNTHVRTVLLGLTAQLMLMTAYTFLGGDAEVHRFFQRYRTIWEKSYGDITGRYSLFDKNFELTRDSFAQRLNRIQELANAEDLTKSSRIERAWLAHCRELRDRVRAAANRSELLLLDGDTGVPAPVSASNGLEAVLLSSYIHMTSNRLGALISDEVYLSYLIERVLESNVASP